jgi:hypothetical protein
MEFGASFVENATRADVAADPSTTTNSLKGFDVWGFMDEPAGKVFEGEDVTGSKGNFTYNNTQYWLPEHDYYFAALAPMNSANWDLDTTKANKLGAGVVTFKNIDGTEDLLYAATTVSTYGKEVGEAMDAVKFQFHHLLSKVKFTFTNGFDNENAFIDVKNVRMVVPAKASIDVAQADWWSTNEWEKYEGTTTLAFGDACAKTGRSGVQQVAEERLTIPAGADQVYEIAFEAQLYFGDVAAWKQDVTLTATVNGVALEMGKAYNFKATIDASNISPDGVELQPIVFDVENVNEWNEAGDVDFAPSVKVATADELVKAINAGVDVTLTQDIDLDATRAAGDYAGLAVGTDVVIDGAGHSIKSAAIRAINIVGGNRQVTLKNLVVEGRGERAINIEFEGNVVNIENVTASSTHYVVNLVGSAEENVVTISNCELTGLNVVNVWGTKSQVTVNDTKLVVYQDGTEDDAFAAIKICNQATYAKVTVNGGEIVAGGLNLGGAVEADDAEIIFNGTKGNCTIENNPFVINYGQYNYSFATFQEAYDYAKGGETIVLCQDITIDNVLKVVDKNVTFNLNGHNISSVTDVFEVAGGALTIIGDGEVHAATTNGTQYCAVWAYGEAVVNIYGGTYKIGYPTGDYNDLIYANGNAAINIYGGTFHNSGSENAFVLNVNDQNRATAAINVYGGSYEKFNPADNKSEGPGTNFVAPGKTVEKNNDWYIVK